MIEGDRHPRPRWLLLIHQLPTKPAYFRVKIWRRLQRIGAVAVKSTVYALPANTETHEDFAWLLKEITEGGGEAMVCEAQMIGGISDAQIRALFDAARDEDYQAVADEGRALIATLEVAGTDEGASEVGAQLKRLRKRLTEIARIDFFGANGRESVEGLLSDWEARVSQERSMMAEPIEGSDEAASLKGKTWITRQSVHVDRIACAWLIKRFIDPEATIRFVPGKSYEPKENELRFDMFEGEFTHQGDLCSFEVFLARTGMSDPALQAIAEIVHDIDLKDEKFGRDETLGIAHLITGISMADDDNERIDRGVPIFDSLYQYFRKQRR